VNDAEPGIRRIRRGTGFTYRSADGHVLRDAAALARIRALAIPPAWENVWICAHAQGHLQATGLDARGRKQYRYHARWCASRSDSKFEQLRRFGQALPRIRRRVLRALSVAGDGAVEPTRERVLATVARLLDDTCVRIGNAAYARENQSFGLSTLHTRHAAVRGDQVELSFVGKGGIRHRVRLSDRRVARVVRRCRELPGRELFQWRDAAGEVHRIDSGDVNDWLAAAAAVRITAKDFRTWHGSVLALELTLAACAESAAPCRAQQVLAEVARRLGNTPAVCRKAYIHPRVLALSTSLADARAREQLRDRPWVKRPPPLRGASLCERQLLGLLKSARR
jgi:DNA topoisomerase-1